MKHLSLLAAAIALILTGCGTSDPAQPTVAPTVGTVSPTAIRSTTTRVSTGTPPPTLAITYAPSPTFRPMISATPAPVTAPPVNVVAIAPTQKPNCIKAGKSDTVTSLLVRGGGYGDLSAAPAFRELNNMGPGNNNIVEGNTYCIPVRTLTPTPPGYEKTRAASDAVLGTKGATTLLEYKITDKDTSLGLEFKFGVTLGQMCALNPPPDSGIYCPAECKLDAPLGQAGCRPIVSAGRTLRLPGPSPTPTITPTLTGSETPTATPGYYPPRVVAPEAGAQVNGQIRLRWLPAGGILAANERYMLLMSEPIPGGNARNFQYFSDGTSFLVPPGDLPQEDGLHVIYWQIGVARIEPDGSAVLISERTPAVTFNWTR